MSEWSFLGKSLMGFSVILFIVGLLLTFSGHLPQLPWLGRLPGDISIRRENFSFYFPLASCILVSVFLSLGFLIFSNFWRR
ncbi:MAG: DUF2905 domain-containing protein [Candidatus Omnitrophica bacterium]|nr:DUF2905 domain-containing protein [Candidatus Omnitrophota bacterium]